MEKKTLDQILSEFSDLEKLLIEIELDEQEGVDTVEAKVNLEEKLNINRNELENKLNGYYYISEKLKSEAEFDALQEKRFKQRKTAKLNSSQRLKDRIDLAMSLYGIEDSKSKAKIPSLKFATDHCKFTAVSYPVIDPTTIPPVEEMEKEIDGQYLDYTSQLKISQQDAKLIEKAINLYNEKVGNIKNEPALIPEFIPQINTDKVKSDLKENIKIGELKLLNNYKTRIS